jgi:BMFP domain-containing protein YqiC
MVQAQGRVKKKRRLAFWARRHYVNRTKRGFAMSTGPNRILDEFAKLMTDAAGAAQGVRREVETAFRGQAERILNTMELVQREEFEVARDMAAKAREENAKLSARIDALEARLAELTANPEKSASSASPASPAKK